MNSFAKKKLTGFALPKENELSRRSFKEFHFSYPSKLELYHSELSAKLKELLDQFPEVASFGVRAESPWSRLVAFLQARKYLGEVTLEEVFNDELPLYYFMAGAVFDHRKTDSTFPNYINLSRGISDNYFEALSKAIGEFLERYSLTFYYNSNLIRASLSAMRNSGESFMDFSRFPYFSDLQKKSMPHIKFDDDEIFRWERARSLVDGREVMVPAQYIYWSYDRHTDAGFEPLLKEGNTNGAGGFFSRAGAILSGLYELIQRDSFFMHWLNGIPPKRINIESIPDERLQKGIRDARALGFEADFFDTTSDVDVPASFCVIRDPSGVGPYFSLGAGCSFGAASQLRRAFIEAFSIYHWNRLWGKKLTLPADYTPFRDHSIDQMGRVSLWWKKEVYDLNNAFFSGEEKSFDSFASKGKKFSNEDRELKEVTRQISKLGEGYEPLVYEVKHRMLADVGYHSAQTIVPALLPLYLYEDNVPLGSKRLEEAAIRLRFPTSKSRPTTPHPFP